ncbi:hypothetical protein C9374_004222 [Naegleria lovaniensis]|uniref:Uncharacterized protein n=1 Tax=Naegleria lovaniensis TaxID=51637 RepID=A0AA88GM36_NAELO|nr:uncharacterized protein C9374_004222 [Naegleria lovaniensis]KAG2383551.1 hypothetical protein C9374_004222 [Naegleria lovaniensis]
MKLEVFADGNENLNCYLAKPFSDRHGFAKSRSCCQGVLYDDKMYFYGGTPHPNGNDFYSDIVQYIDLKTINYELGEMEIHEVTITQPGIKPEGRIFHSLICDDESTNGKPASMIVYGGFTDGRRLLNNCFSFQFENKIWKKNSNGPCLEGHTAIFRKKNRTMIVFGGHMGSYKHFENSTYEYDIVKDIWTKLNIDNSSIVSPLAYHRAVYVEELDWMVVHGGKTKPGRTAILSSNVYILNFATMRWHVLNQEPMAFDNSSNSSVLPSSNLTLPKIMAQQSICVESSIIFFGGETEDSDVPSQQLFVINLETLEIIEYCPYQHEPGLLQRKYVDKSYTEPEATVIPPLYDSCCIYDHTSSNIFAYGGRLYSLEIPFMVAVHVSETNCTENSLFDYWKNNINSQTLTSYLQAYFNDSQVSEHSFYDEVSHTSHNVHHLVLEKYPNILTSNIEKRLLKLLLKFLHGYNIIFEIESGKELVSLLESSKV